ncbi:MAG: T9SS type A sorting domain-containing protein [candidate division Zixibacteria bacterium]|nr:T9SS type A sorting domain-containing protein [candidate division Zixibacteria bacterium]
MKRSFFILVVLFLFAFGASAWSQCSEDGNDHGVCDSMYVEAWPDDTLLQGDPPYFVRVPIYVTTDVVDPTDSISGFAIPLCYTHTNASKYCSVASYWNNTKLFPSSKRVRSIFRHITDPVSGDTLVHNRMMSLSEPEEDLEWDTIILNLTSDSCWYVYEGGVESVFVAPRIWFSMAPSGPMDQLWWEGSKVLLATITFKLEDSMTICIDTCWWPPTSNLIFQYELGVRFATPRIGHPDQTSYEVCFGLRKPADVREIHGSDETRPLEFSLSENYPNPFNPVTNFEFSLSKPVHVKIEIFNIIGQKVRTLVDEEMNPGVYVVDWGGKDENERPVSSGIYFYRMQAGDFSDMKKMVLLK